MNKKDLIKNFKDYSPEQIAEAINTNMLITDDYMGLFLLDKEYKHRYVTDEQFGLWSQMQNLDEEMWSEL